jgi:methionyl-tRNA formyltransferase
MIHISSQDYCGQYDSLGRQITEWDYDLGFWFVLPEFIDDYKSGNIDWYGNDSDFPAGCSRDEVDAEGKIISVSAISKKHKERIIFFASGDFPVKTLEELIDDRYNIVGIVTSKDKHEFKDSTNSSVSQIGNKHNIPVIIPKDINDDETYEWLCGMKPDIFCVISYKKLSDRVIEIPTMGSFNIHASILPFLRGAAPINWALRLGFKETGLTAFWLSSKIDSGNIICNTKIDIDESDNYQTLYWKLSDMSAEFTEIVLEKIISNNTDMTICQSVPLDNEIFKAPKPDADYTKHWTQIGYWNLKNLLRSIYPKDGLYLNICIMKKHKLGEDCEVVKEIICKVFDCEILTNIEYHGNLHETDNKTYLRVIFDEPYRTDVWCDIKEIQQAGKKRMKIADFMRGVEVWFANPDYDIYVTDY